MSQFWCKGCGHRVVSAIPESNAAGVCLDCRLKENQVTDDEQALAQWEAECRRIDDKREGWMGGTHAAFIKPGDDEMPNWIRLEAERRYPYPPKPEPRKTVTLSDGSSYRRRHGGGFEFRNAGAMRWIPSVYTEDDIRALSTLRPPEEGQ